MMDDRLGGLAAATERSGSSSERGLSAQDLRFLADASSTLSATLEFETTLASVARLSIPRFADWCAVDMLEEDGTIVRLAAAAADPDKERILRDSYRRYPVETNDEHPVVIALREGTLQWTAEVAQDWPDRLARDSEHLALLRTLAPTSFITAPLVARGHVLGALTFAFAESDRRYRAADVELARELAHRAALAIDNARLYREAQTEIAARRRVEQELRFRTSLLQAQSEASIEGILVVSPERRMIAYNRRFLDIWRLDRALVEGDSNAAAESVMHMVVDAEPMKALTAYLYEHPDETGRDEIPLKDGRTLERNSAPIRGEDGVHYGRIWFYRDITDRIRAEAELRRREETLSAIVAASPDIIAIRGMDGRTIEESASVRDVLGYEPAGAEGQRSFGLVHHDDRAEQVASFRALLDGTTDRNLTRYRYRHADGGWVTLESHRRVIRDADGRPAGVASVTRDVTDRAALEAELLRAKEAAERANRAKSEFLSRMSHELRTPLNAILGFAEVMEMDPQTTAKQHERLKHIVKGGRHLLGLINEVLDIARIETDRLSLSPEPVAVADLVYEALDLTRPLAARRNVRLYIESPERFDHHIHADAQRLKQVLLNLLANGVKYNRDGGSVTVFGDERPGGAVRISLRDTGPGIPAEKLDRLFTPFDRLGAESSGEEGTGLGLAIAKRLVEAMGGGIGVESAVGSGSTFWVELPRTESPLHQFATDGRALLRFGGEGVDKQATVLYIEDNLANLELMEHVLAFRPGVRLLPAITGELGIALAQDHHPDLILLDLNLPDIQGDEVLRRLRADPATSTAPVIVISADATEHQIQRLLGAGALAYLTKPLEVQRLLGVLEKHL